MHTTQATHAPSDAAGRPIVLVTRATGAQGGSVARHLLRRGRFAVRALTRNLGGAAAGDLRTLGAEVVCGDLSDAESLRDAMAGCYGVFGVTSLWEHFDGQYQHALNLMDAVSDSGVGHFVFSTLTAVRGLTDGALSVPYFDLKARMQAYARSLSVPATFIHVAYYFDNRLSFIVPRREGDGSCRYEFRQEDTWLAGVAAEDVGGVTATIFERRAEFMGRNLYMASDDLPLADFAAILTRLMGCPIT